MMHAFRSNALVCLSTLASYTLPMTRPFAKRHPQVLWGFAFVMRIALAHGHFTLDLDQWC